MTAPESLIDWPTTRSPVTPAVAVADQRSIYISSILAMTAIVFVLAGAPCWYAFDLIWGLAIGTMGAIWIGPGFGTMVAGARIAVIEDQHAAATRRPTRR